MRLYTCNLATIKNKLTELKKNLIKENQSCATDNKYTLSLHTFLNGPYILAKSPNSS